MQKPIGGRSCKIQKHENQARNKSNNPQRGKREKRHSINKPTIQRNPTENDSGSYVKPMRKEPEPSVKNNAFTLLTAKPPADLLNL